MTLPSADNAVKLKPQTKPSLRPGREGDGNWVDADGFKKKKNYLGSSRLQPQFVTLLYHRYLKDSLTRSERKPCFVQRKNNSRAFWMET